MRKSILRGGLSVCASATIENESSPMGEVTADSTNSSLSKNAILISKRLVFVFVQPGHAFIPNGAEKGRNQLAEPNSSEKEAWLQGTSTNVALWRCGA